MSEAIHERWAADRFFWSVVEAPQWDRPGVLPTGLLAAFEEDCPVPASDLHVVCTPLGDGRLLACAAHRQDLARIDGRVLSVTPEALPPLSVEADPASLNLLVGRFEPALVARTRKRLRVLSAAALAVLCGLGVLGFERRAERHARLANEARKTAEALLASYATRDADSLNHEVARLQSNVRWNAELQRPTDATEALCAVLSGWPRACAAKTQSLSVGPAGATVVASVAGDPSEFIGAFTLSEGWVMDEPRLNRNDAATRLTLHMRRKPGVQE